MRALVVGAVSFVVIAIAIATIGDEPIRSRGSTPDWLMVTVYSTSQANSSLVGPYMVDTGSVLMVTPNTTDAGQADPLANIVVGMVGSGITLHVRETVREVCAAIGNCRDLTQATRARQATPE